MYQTATEAVIHELCHELRLPAIAKTYPETVRAAQTEDWPYEGFLQELLQNERTQRRQNTAAARLRQAGFPDAKTIDQLSWSELKGISKTKVQALCSGQFIADAEDVVILGPIGTGKTHLAIALGVEAARRRTRVAFMRTADLVRQLVEARDERQLGRLHNRYLKIPLLILDELGFVPLNKMEAELLFNLLAERYEKRSTVVTSNLSFGEWVQVFGSEKLTTALLDRLTHHSHILTTKGKSYRTNHKKTKTPNS